MDKARIRIWSRDRLLRRLRAAICIAAIGVGALAEPGCIPQTWTLESATATSCAIPSCSDCTVVVDAHGNATATTKAFPSYSCTYLQAGMFLNAGSTQVEIGVNIPQPGAPYKDSFAVPFKPSTANLCMYYRYGSTGLKVCNQVNFGVK